jgi:hypothetical protein
MEVSRIANQKALPSRIMFSILFIRLAAAIVRP